MACSWVKDKLAFPIIVARQGHIGPDSLGVFRNPHMASANRLELCGDFRAREAFRCVA